MYMFHTGYLVYNNINQSTWEAKVSMQEKVDGIDTEFHIPQRISFLLHFPSPTSLPFFYQVSLPPFLHSFPSFLSSFFMYLSFRKYLLNTFYIPSIFAFLDFCEWVKEKTSNNFQQLSERVNNRSKKFCYGFLRRTLILQRKEKCYLQLPLAIFLLPKGIWFLAWGLNQFSINKA